MAAEAEARRAAEEAAAEIPREPESAAPELPAPEPFETFPPADAELPPPVDGGDEPSILPRLQTSEDV